MWELGNSTYSALPVPYLDTITAYIHAHDPYRHLVTDGGTQAEDINAGLDAVGDNKYATCDDVEVDNFLAAVFNPMRTTYNRPMLLGEGGGASPQGDYSPRRFRLQIWTTFLLEGGICFWPSFGYFPVNVGRNGVQGAESNQNLGYEEFVESKILSDLSSNFDGAAVPLAVTLTPANQIRAYALGSAKDQAVYIVHYANHNSILSNGTVQTAVPAACEGQWMDPATGALLKKVAVSSGTQTLAIPPFMTDIFLRLRPSPVMPVLQFGSPAVIVESDQSSVSLKVLRLGNPGLAVTVDYATADGIAKSGADYSPVSGTLSWAAGDTAGKTITVPLIVRNTLLKRVNTQHFDFRVVLGNLTGGAVLGYDSAALVFKHNVVVNSASTHAGGYVVNRDAGALQIQVDRHGNGAGPLSVYYYTNGAGGTDFTGIPTNTQKFNWADGDMSSRTFSITILPTAVHGRTFIVEMVGADSVSTVWPTGRTGIVIVDPDTSHGVLSFSGQTGFTRNGWGVPVAQFPVKGDAGSTVLRVSRMGGGTGAVSVPWSTQDVGDHVGTARPGIDYTDGNGTLNWANNDTADKLITLPVTNNMGLEHNVNTTFYVYLFTPTGGAINNFPQVAEVTIVNDSTGGTPVSDPGPVTLANSVSVFPNPFNPTTSIRVRLNLAPSDPGQDNVEMTIFDIRGQSVRHIVQPVSAGKGIFNSTISWDSRDRAGKGVASGAYFLAVKYKTSILKQRMMLIR
jgi:hypothetical protein